MLLKFWLPQRPQPNKGFTVQEPRADVFHKVKFFTTQPPVEKAASSVDGFPSRKYSEWRPRMRMTYFFAYANSGNFNVSASKL